jgi:hypothetical protein
MRASGSKFLKKRSARNLSQSRELRDAVVFEIFPTSHFCTVKIQGSDQTIKAFYNENWGTTPQWLKLGNPVRITTPRGSAGRIEVAGNGFSLPIAIPGGNVTPTPPTSPDAILSGCGVTASGNGLTASVKIGTYRLSGAIYVLDIIGMDILTLEMDRPDVTMDDTGGVVSFDSIASGYFRYDLIVVDAIGAVSVEKGTAATSNPVLPDVPADNVLMGWVLLSPTTNGIILQKDVGAVWKAPAPSVLSVTGTVDLPWSTEETELTLQVLDQYGEPVDGTYFVDIVQESGNGSLSGGVSEPLAFSNIGYVTYTRFGEPPGESEDAVSSVLTFTESSVGVANTKTITLRDSGGEIMI